MTRNQEEAREQVVQELHKLVEDQLQTLRGELGPVEVVSYATRKKRIDELIELLSRPIR